MVVTSRQYASGDVETTERWESYELVIRTAARAMSHGHLVLVDAKGMIVMDARAGGSKHSSSWLDVMTVVRRELPSIVTSDSVDTRRSSRFEVAGVMCLSEPLFDAQGGYFGAICVLCQSTFEDIGVAMVGLLRAWLQMDQPHQAATLEQDGATADATVRKLSHDIGNQVATIDMAVQVLLVQRSLSERTIAKYAIIRDACREIIHLVTAFTNGYSERKHS